MKISIRLMVLMGLIVIVLGLFAAAQQTTVPKEIDTTTLQKITQEHKNTRKFFSDELTRQRQEFFKQMDDRANYYENTVNHLLSSAILQLGLIWAGIVLFITGITQFLRLKLERNKFDKMLKTIRYEIINTRQVVQQQKPAENIINTHRQEFVKSKDLNVAGDRIIPPQESLKMPAKKSWSERMAEKKAAKKLNKLQKQMQKLKEQESRIKGTGRTQQQQQQPPMQEHPQPDVKYNFEVDY